MKLSKLLLAGFRRVPEVKINLILCMMRNFSIEENKEVIRLAKSTEINMSLLSIWLGMRHLIQRVLLNRYLNWPKREHSVYDSCWRSGWC